MDQRVAFIELSTLLTGVYTIANDRAQRRLSETTADEYLLRLTGDLPDRLPKLLAAYDRLASVTPKPPIDDALLRQLRAEPEFGAHQFATDGDREAPGRRHIRIEATGCDLP